MVFPWSYKGFIVQWALLCIQTRRTLPSLNALFFCSRHFVSAESWQGTEASASNTGCDGIFPLGSPPVAPAGALFSESFICKKWQWRNTYFPWARHFWHLCLQNAPKFYAGLLLPFLPGPAVSSLWFWDNECSLLQHGMHQNAWGGGSLCSTSPTPMKQPSLSPKKPFSRVPVSLSSSLKHF